MSELITREEWFEYKDAKRFLETVEEKINETIENQQIQQWEEQCKEQEEVIRIEILKVFPESDIEVINKLSEKIRILLAGWE